MIKINHILFIFLFAFFVIPVSADNFVLVIDPGHGGQDPGARGRRGKEKDVNLAVSKLLGQYISEAHPDVKIIYTRKNDVLVGLDERADIANKANANLFISIHSNSVERKPYVKGAEVFTFGVTRTAENLEVAKRENSVIKYEENYEQKYEGFDPNSSESYIIFEFMVNHYVEQSINFASMVQNELVKTAGRGNRGVKQAGYLVLRKSTMPRVLVELDFISNAEAENYLLSPIGQRTLARSLSNAFTKYKAEFDRIEKKTGIEKPAIKNEKTSTTKEQPPSQGERWNNFPEKPVAPELPVMQVVQEKPENVVSSKKIYKIQVKASPVKLNEKSKELKGYKTDYFIEGNYYKYTIGESSNWNEINDLRKKIRKDFKDAFIITFENGVKISVN